MVARWTRLGGGGGTAVATLSRRTFLGAAGAAAVGAYLTPGVAAATSASADRSARPTRGSGVVVLNLIPFFETTGPATVEVFQSYLQRFAAQHPGVRVNVSLGSILPSAVIAGVLAGTGPDVFNEWQLQELMSGGYLLPLDALIRRDNVSLSDYPPMQVAELQYKGETYGIPNATAVPAWLVNFTLLDQLGLQRPSPDWDYLAFERLARAVAGQVKGQWRYGAGWFVPHEYMYKGWGASYVDRYGGTRCELASSAAIAAAEWIFSLLSSRAATYNWISPNEFQTGAAAMLYAFPSYMPTVLQSTLGLEWDFLPDPSWPVAQGHYTVSNGYVINAQTRYPELAWELMKFLVVDPGWQRAMFKMYLLPPALLSLYDEWIETVRAVVPVLRDKNLGIFKDMILSGACYPHQNFAYASGQAYSIVGGYYGKILGVNGSVYWYGWEPVPGPARMSVSEALTMAAEQVNALEAAQGALATAEQAALARTRGLLQAAAGSASTVGFPPPPQRGMGRPAVAAPDALTVVGDAYSLRASGTGVLGGTIATSPAALGLADISTFACLPWTSSSGIFTCRVTAVGSDKLADFAGTSVGLMVRGDLSDEAAYCRIELHLATGMQTEVRPQPAMVATTAPPGSAPGLLTGVFAAGTPPQNALRAPVWLRLVRRADLWTPFASLDGRTWQQAGGPLALLAAGVWVGIFVAPGPAPTSERIWASFDHLDFHPTRAYRIG